MFLKVDVFVDVGAVELVVAVDKPSISYFYPYVLFNGCLYCVFELVSPSEDLPVEKMLHLVY